jgi:uncharacterized protein YPO0396
MTIDQLEAEKKQLESQFQQAQLQASQAMERLTLTKGALMEIMGLIEKQKIGLKAAEALEKMFTPPLKAVAKDRAA